MKLIIGLGNPENEYRGTRHNAGFEFVDHFQAELQLPAFAMNKKFSAEISEGHHTTLGKIILVKPQTFMNNSGSAVRTIISYYNISLSDIMIVHDDLDIEIGHYKKSSNIRAAGHNGVQSIIDCLGTQEFTRIRIGVEALGGRTEREQIPGDAYVLQKFSSEEYALLLTAIQEIITNIKKPLFD